MTLMYLELFLYYNVHVRLLVPTMFDVYDRSFDFGFLFFLQYLLVWDFCLLLTVAL